MANDKAPWWLVPLAIGGLIVGGIALSSASKKAEEDLGITKEDLEKIKNAIPVMKKIKKLSEHSELGGE